MGSSFCLDPERAGRFILLEPKSIHVTILLKTLQWLPISCRVKAKFSHWPTSPHKTCSPFSPPTITFHPNHHSVSISPPLCSTTPASPVVPAICCYCPLLWDVLPDIHVSNTLTCSTSALKWHLLNEGSHPPLASIPNLPSPSTTHCHNMLLYTLPVHCVCLLQQEIRLLGPRSLSVLFTDIT